MGIGRNEYIDIMNRSKTGKGIFRKRVAPKLLLPAEPVCGGCCLGVFCGNVVPFAQRVPSKMEPWWIVNVGLVPEAAVRVSLVIIVSPTIGIDSFLMLVQSILPLERMTLDKLIDSGRSPAGVIDRGALESTATRGAHLQVQCN